MRILLHGENIVASRNTLVEMLEEARDKGLEVVILEGKKVTLEKIRSALETGSLLGEDRLLVIENFLSLVKSKEKAKVIEYLASGKFDNDLVLWEDKEVRVSSIPPKTKAQLFKISPVIFRFLESLRPDNKKETLTLLAEAKKQGEPEMIYHMLVRQFRSLLSVVEGNKTVLPEWQYRKLTNQARFFSKTQLIDLYGQLLEIDFAQKTSKDPFSLSSRLDLFMASL